MLPRSPSVLCAFATISVLAGCGADGDYAETDAGPRDARVIRRDAAPGDSGSTYTNGSCGGTRRGLSPTNAEVIFVIDRSGSMAEAGSDGSPKWNELTRSLDDVLPTADTQISMGLLAFPGPAADTIPMTVETACDAPTSLLIEPQFRQGSALTTRLAAMRPNGNTPTRAALLAAAHFFDIEPDSVGHRYIVLATDGGPNCGVSQDYTSCRCTAPTEYCRAGVVGSEALCLDDAATVATIREIASRGIQTFVIGLAGTRSFGDVMDAMAVAGGRPQSGTTRYYDASSASEITSALSSITSGIIDCRFDLDTAPPDPENVDVRLGGRSLLRDVRHRDGWDWSDDGAHREIVFYGATCDAVRAASGGETLEAAFGCPPELAPP